eukprot:717855-Pyramimonas_sp.AAC.1
MELLPVPTLHAPAHSAATDLMTVGSVKTKRARGGGDPGPVAQASPRAHPGSLGCPPGSQQTVVDVRVPIPRGSQLIAAVISI